MIKCTPKKYNVDLEELLRMFEVNKLIDGKWVPSRPLNIDNIFVNFKYAWFVFIGKCDVLEWPENQ